MFVRDWMPAASKYPSERKLRSYRRVTVSFALISALIAWWIATGTTVSILDMLLFAFAMVVPAAISVSYVLYWRRTTEPGAYWGMLAGYGAGGVWFLLIKLALWTELQASPTAFPIVRLAVSLLTANGEGLDRYEVEGVARRPPLVHLAQRLEGQSVLGKPERDSGHSEKIHIEAADQNEQASDYDQGPGSTAEHSSDGVLSYELRAGHLGGSEAYSGSGQLPALTALPGRLSPTSSLPSTTKTPFTTTYSIPSDGIAASS